MFNVAKTDAFALTDAEVKFLDVGILAQLFGRTVQNDAAVFEDITMVRVTQRDIGILLGQ